MIDIRVPQLGESINEATIARWLKSQGNFVNQDEPLVELETDKVTLEVTAPTSGTLTIILAPATTEVRVGDVIAKINESVSTNASPPDATQKPQDTENPHKTPPPPVYQTASQDDKPPQKKNGNPNLPYHNIHLTPAARRLVAEEKIDTTQFETRISSRRITKGDVLSYLERNHNPNTAQEPSSHTQNVKRVPMSRIRLRIAQRLKEAQHTAATLTTFNEVDMTAILALRTDQQSSFTQMHGVKLGLMSFFVRASVAALRKYPLVNASIDGTDILYHTKINIGVAVATKDALIVPVIHSADTKTFGDIERALIDARAQATKGQLSPSDLADGTFTITNGGVFGSLLSTPLLNPPQSAILGMHTIQKRPVVNADGAIVVRDMMYVALSYDHRLIDGKEAISFLLTIKENLEDPSRLFLAF
ncbi:MAG: 2-oxoglutarate dehydrogenase complex dihydrolipoyllysine-residue succinyltransferase [Alphaproteobacteria bacterium]|nr:MAG: 2-oxoglutarate dehydrogenase complex dihydrolipoyllysine-residue succinyltransferase [Alphaproteobacteria bacterium]